MIFNIGKYEIEIDDCARPYIIALAEDFIPKKYIKIIKKLLKWFVKSSMYDILYHSKK